MLRFSKYWGPVAVFMALIFVGSTDWLSGKSTGRFLIPLIKFLLPAADESLVNGIRFLIRKMGHLTEYAILAILLWRALTFSGRPGNTDKVEWSPRIAFLAWLCASLYAVSDEFHQSFVPSRVGSPFDVMIDAAGAGIAILILFLIRRKIFRPE